MPKNLFDFLRKDFTRDIFYLLVFLVFLFFIPHNALAVSDSMLGYWKFDNCVSGICGDYSGHNNNAVFDGSTSWNSNTAPTIYPNTRSIVFPSENSYLTFGSAPILQPTSSLTLSFWIYIDTQPSVYKLAVGNFETAYPYHGYYFKIDPPYINFHLENGSPSTPTVSFHNSNLTSGWNLLTATWDGSNVILYLNGSQKAINTNVTGIAYTTSQYAQFQAGHYQGKIDDLRLYNRALSPEEIETLANGNHISATWTGYDSDFTNGNNWNTGYKPDPYTKINIPSSSGPQPAFVGENEQLAGITIGSGASLNIHEFSLTLNDSAPFSNNGNFILENRDTQEVAGFVNDTDSGTITINPPASAIETGLKTGSSYFNLNIGSTSITPPPSVTLNSSINVTSNLHIENGTFNASGYTITVKGDFTSSSSGTFSPGTSTVILAGTNQAIQGTNSFWNLNKTTSTADTLNFAANKTQTILNTLTLQGASSAGQYLSLRSTTAGTQWNIDPVGTTRNVSSLDIKDSLNVGSTIVLTGSNIDSGNNDGWNFGTSSSGVVLNSVSSPNSDATPTISGTASSSISTIEAVNFKIDSTSGTSYSCTASDGVFDEVSENFSCSLSSALSDDTHTIYVTSTDVNDQVATSSVSFRIDTQAPDISSVSADPNTTSADISWDTDEQADSKVEYGKSSDYGKSESDSDDETDHKISLSGLSSCTEYHYRVKSKDPAGNEEKSSDKSFKTSGCTTTSTTTSTTNTTPASTTSTTESTSTAPTNTTTSTPSSTNNATVPQTNTSSSSSSASSIIEPDYKAEVNQDWQKEYFGTETCQDSTVCGGLADPDNDGMTNNDEMRFNTDPNNPDSDNDGLRDGTEIESGFDPTKNSNEGDEIVFENPKEKGQISKNKYKINNVELTEEAGKKKLKITGKGPANTYLTVYVFSDPVVLTVKTDDDGNWSYVLENNLEDGSHEVYVAVTDNTGKISAKGEPIAFVKTAEAVTIIPPAEAAAERNAQSPTKKRFSTDLIMVILFAFVGLVVALLLIGLYRYKSGKKESSENAQPPISL